MPPLSPELEHLHAVRASLQQGVGVARVGEDGEPAKPVNTALQPKVPDFTEEVDANGEPLWSPQCSFLDQLYKRPETCRFLGRTFKVFDLNKPSDVEELNRLSRRFEMRKDSSPEGIINSIEKHFCDDTHNWRILVEYTEIVYKKLVPKATQ